MTSTTPILLVEDDDVDVENVTRAFEENRLTNPLVIARHGEHALQLLSKHPSCEEGSSATRPGLILLDINMPIMNGIEFLTTLKENPSLCTIPVVVLTTSQEESDRKESFCHWVAGYFLKPVEYEDFVRVIGVIVSYWTLSESAP